MLGSLATHLRMCGHDAAYALDREEPRSSDGASGSGTGPRGVEDDDRIRELAREEDRTLLTRDEQLAASVEDALLIESKSIEGQLAELAAAGVPLSLGDPERCGRCNGRLEPVDREETTPEYAPEPAETNVWQCEECGQYFWKGSHWERVAEQLPN